jgi:hypothetical protein
MKRIVDYSILVESDSVKMETRVKGKLDDGWQPLGSPLQSGKDLLQALVKYEDALNDQHEKPVD